MDAFSLIITAIAVAVTLQAALVTAAIGCMVFAAIPAAIGWVASRLLTPIFTPPAPVR